MSKTQTTKGCYPCSLKEKSLKRMKLILQSRDKTIQQLEARITELEAKNA